MAFIVSLLNPLDAVPAYAEFAKLCAAWTEQVKEAMVPGLFKENGSQVTKGWPLTRLDHALVIVGAYLGFVLVGTMIFKRIYGEEKVTGKPVKSEQEKGLLHVIMLFYNLVQVGLCAYMMQGALVEAFRVNSYRFICNDFNVAAAGMAHWNWIFYCSKILDFCDTIFIVVRGKWRQLSFLHVYHHTTIYLFYWLNANFAYDGDIYYTIAVNSFIHLVMYAYYFFSATTGIPQYLKRTVTILQLVQFVTMMGQAAYLLISGCPYPRNVTGVYFIYILSLFYLFSDFFTGTYSKEKKKTT